MAGIKGAYYPRPQLFYTLPGPSSLSTLKGGFWMMAPVNRAVVQRTWALNTLAARESPQTNANLNYGKDFTYDEFLVMPSRIASMAMSLGLAMTGICLMFAPVCGLRHVTGSRIDHSWHSYSSVGCSSASYQHLALVLRKSALREVLLMACVFTSLVTLQGTEEGLPRSHQHDVFCAKLRDPEKMGSHDYQGSR
jgi:hypothetical protein